MKGLQFYHHEVLASTPTTMEIIDTKVDRTSTTYQRIIRVITRLRHEWEPVFVDLEDDLVRL